MNLPRFNVLTGLLSTHVARICVQLLCLCCASFCGPLFAAEAEGLYQSEVVVSSRDDARERNKAFTSGLEGVLVKVTGRADTPKNPEIRRQIQNTQSLVEGWAYQTRNVEGSEQLYLQINYFQPEIQRLLDSADVPLWPANRPETLVWVVTQDELGERTLADPAATEPEVYESLKEAAKLRGLPLRMPQMDEQDRAAVDAEQVWAMDQEALRAASQRYGSQSILALRLFRTLAGETYAKATYLLRDRALDLERLEDPEPDFLNAAIALAAEELASTFAVRLSSTQTDSSSVKLDVSGVHGVADYAALLHYLEGLTVVNNVQVLAANGDKLTLQLRAGGQLRQLMETLAIEQKLVQQGEPVRTEQEVALQYLWQNQP